ncbi:ATP-dependent helicase HrpB [marine gamma proteobacterium HTCC2143]|uniref:ATP-dependent helicase HrpB n=1 Tax=marine gamma proteobacterium HTCC2143 TaxID=247633 RepID=A0YC48_9GAMM|nr:ATP-dependent helicase HrpB [marine gamma proteobacterium HTCC2143]
MSIVPELPELPISDVLTNIDLSLEQHLQLVLEAPPGAGKTTLVPLSILKHQSDKPIKNWLGQQRILMLEPRRMAARSAATRMASLLNEPVGKTVGYRVRQETKVSRHTRIEVITEGILVRMLIQDPSLADIGLLIFDEFHERSLDADLGLAFALQGREIFRDASNPLRILIMSATLDGSAIASLLDSAREDPTDTAATPIISSLGKQYPVAIHYGARKQQHEDIIKRTVLALIEITNTLEGDILVFLPGYKEINNVRGRFSASLSDSQSSLLHIFPLYGALPFALQQQAIEPLSQADRQRGARKIVLATDIAETSLTIEGITIVIDSGLCRQPIFSPATGMTRLQTNSISQDSSIQRMGRAGRLEPGQCFRLWSEEQQKLLPRHSPPEILQADLASLTLQLLAWGIHEPEELAWLDIPPRGALSQALDLLKQLGVIQQHDKQKALTDNEPALDHWVLTPHGTQLVSLPIHPRLAHMLLRSRTINQQKVAAALAVLLTDRSPLSNRFDTDITTQIAIVQGTSHCQKQFRSWQQRAQRQALLFEKLLSDLSTDADESCSENDSDANAIAEQNAAGYLLACAYPDRIARRKSAHSNQYLLSNGRTAIIDFADPCCGHEWLSAAEVVGSTQTQKTPQSNNTDRIYSACPLDINLFDGALSYLINASTSIHWDENTDRFSAEKTHAVGAIVLRKERLENITLESKINAIVTHIQKRGLNILPWTKSTRQWQARVTLLRRIYSSSNDKARSPWPDVSDQHLLASLEHWLTPFLSKIGKRSDFDKLDLQAILNTLLPWPLPQQLTALAPLTITVPSGHQAGIDYSQTSPVLNVKLQEMFGCRSTPTIAEGNIKLIVQLLSPARRPLQVTQDLEGFWKTSYHDVKKEMRGRYPKHPWPDNPLEAVATKYTKRNRDKG